MDNYDPVFNLINQLIDNTGRNSVENFLAQAIKNLLPIDKVFDDQNISVDSVKSFNVSLWLNNDRVTSFNENIRRIISKDYYHYYTELDNNEFINRSGPQKLDRCLV